MTQREQELYDIIRANPSISQNEIARIMNISRSAVSVYLQELYKKKILLGRGYILNEKKYPVVIGPAHVDIRSITDTAKISPSGAYIASQTQVSYGGAAKNIVDYLFNFGQQTKAVLSLGDDDFGRSYMNSCEKLGISPSDFIILPNSTTSVYIELVDENRNTIMTYYCPFDQIRHLTPMAMQAHADVLDTASMFIVHDSVPLSVMEYLHSAYPEQPIFLIGSSESMAGTLIDSFKYVCASVFSLDIAAAMVWKKKIAGVSPEHLPDVCRQLVRLGLKNFYIMADAYTLACCDGKSLTLHTSANPSYSEGCNFAHYYSDCRDIFSAIICYQQLNASGKFSILDYLAAARNLANSRDFYFERSISFSLLMEHAEKLHPTVVSHPL